MAVSQQTVSRTIIGGLAISPVAAYGLWSLFVVIAVALVISVLIPSHQPLQVGDGFTVFALLYIVSQAVERFIEPFSCLILTGDPKTDSDLTDKRTFVFWSITTVLGMIASAWFGIYLLAMVLKDGASSPVPPFVDLLATGAVIGGGAKGVHDLLSNVLSKQQA